MKPSRATEPTPLAVTSVRSSEVVVEVVHGSSEPRKAEPNFVQPCELRRTPVLPNNHFVHKLCYARVVGN